MASEAEDDGGGLGGLGRFDSLLDDAPDAKIEEAALVAASRPPEEMMVAQARKPSALEIERRHSRASTAEAAFVELVEA